MKSPFRSPSNTSKKKTLNTFDTRMNFVVKLKTIQHVNGFFWKKLFGFCWRLRLIVNPPTRSTILTCITHLILRHSAAQAYKRVQHTLSASAYLWWWFKQVGKQVKCNGNGIFSFCTTTRWEHQTAIISSSII